ncbi:hypothetical protein Tco_1179487 [Tanacetum coccineum]
MAMEWLTKGCRSGDSLVFYYAGHGFHVVDYDGDEKDGYDDYSVAGKILDDEVNTILVAPLPHGAKLHSIMDTCFSGTLLDLPYLCRINREGFYKWEDHHPSHVVALYGGASGGRAICISACDDHQNSADTSEPQLSCSTRFEIYSEPIIFVRENWQFFVIKQSCVCQEPQGANGKCCSKCPTFSSLAGKPGLRGDRRGKTKSRVILKPHLEGCEASTGEFPTGNHCFVNGFTPIEFKGTT